MKYQVNYSCGHTEEVQLFGKESERKSKIEYFEHKGLCKECYKAQKAKERAAAGQPSQTQSNADEDSQRDAAVRAGCKLSRADGAGACLPFSLAYGEKESAAYSNNRNYINFVHASVFAYEPQTGYVAETDVLDETCTAYENLMVELYKKWKSPVLSFRKLCVRKPNATGKLFKVIDADKNLNALGAESYFDIGTISPCRAEPGTYISAGTLADRICRALITALEQNA